MPPPAITLESIREAAHVRHHDGQCTLEQRFLDELCIGLALFDQKNLVLRFFHAGLLFVLEWENTTEIY